MADTEGPIASRVFVGNLAWATTDESLLDHMSKAGEVVSASVMRYSDSGRSKGSGLVDFASAEDAERAIADLTDSELDGRTIFVREDRGSGHTGPRPARRTGGSGGAGAGGAPRGPSGGSRGGSGTSIVAPGTPGTAAYVGNLAWATNDDGLTDYFAAFSPVEARVKSRNGRSAGWGVVRFASVDDCNAAISELNNTNLDGRDITVREFREE